MVTLFRADIVCIERYSGNSTLSMIYVPGRGGLSNPSNRTQNEPYTKRLANNPGWQQSLQTVPLLEVDGVGTTGYECI